MSYLLCRTAHQRRMNKKRKTIAKRSDGDDNETGRHDMYRRKVMFALNAILLHQTNEATHHRANTFSYP